MSWKPQIQNAARKISKSIGIICKSSFYLMNSLCTLYYSLVYPYLHYCASVWGSTYQSHLKRLITLQKRVIRIISKSTFDAHTNPIFKNLNILKFENLIKLQIDKIMYLYKNGLLPDSFNDIMVFTSLRCTFICSICLTVEQMLGSFHSVFKDLNYIILLTLMFRMPLVLLCLPLNLRFLS